LEYFYFGKDIPFFENLCIESGLITLFGAVSALLIIKNFVFRTNFSKLTSHRWMNF
jgi:hypothetical protein